jgi:uncharacterized membrane protein YeiH
VTDLNATRRQDQLVLGSDLAATLLFAVEGATVAVNARLDLFGILVIAFVTALGGGMIRDVLLGDNPPAALRFTRYPIAAFIGGFVVFLFSSQVRKISPDVIVVLDAAALSLFAVSGARKALDFETNGLAAALLGMITGVGGGVMRDVLVNRVPLILVAEIYASAAFVGAAAMVIGVAKGGRPDDDSRRGDLFRAADDHLLAGLESAARPVLASRSQKCCVNKRSRRSTEVPQME